MESERSTVACNLGGFRVTLTQQLLNRLRGPANELVNWKRQKLTASGKASLAANYAAGQRNAKLVRRLMEQKRPRMSRLRGFGILVVGVVLIVLGIGMWQSPEVNWKSLVDAGFLAIKEIVRLAQDPFAVVGIIVFAVGIFLALHGAWRVLRG